VLGVAGVNVVLGWRIQTAARDHGDARLVLVASAFIAAAGFLFLHALATPGVLVSGPNTGFFVATPIGLGIAAVLASLSAVEYTPNGQPPSSATRGAPCRVVRGDGRLGGGVAGRRSRRSTSRPTGRHPRHPLAVLAVVSVALYGWAAVRYFQIHRRRPAVMLIGMLTANALLAEAMIAVVFAPELGALVVAVARADDRRLRLRRLRRLGAVPAGRIVQRAVRLRRHRRHRRPGADRTGQRPRSTSPPLWNAPPRPTSPTTTSTSSLPGSPPAST
jgi:hypothetical protein